MSNCAEKNREKWANRTRPIAILRTVSSPGFLTSAPAQLGGESALGLPEIQRLQDRKPDGVCAYDRLRSVAKEMGARRPACVATARQRYSGSGRSEEHTSELQSLMRSSYAVFCLKKKR